MGLPIISVTFATAAETAIMRSGKGTVGIIINDDGAKEGLYTISDTEAITKGISAENRKYIERTFLGAQNGKPRKVIIYILAADETDYSAALAAFEMQQIDYIAANPEISPEGVAQIKEWVNAQRAKCNYVKAVLPDCAADSEGIINFSASGITAGEDTYTAAEYCSRIAGLIAATPMNESVTYAVLDELTAVDSMLKSELDAAVDAGKLTLFSNGTQVKIARGVNSLSTITGAKTAAMKKIKIVEAMDMIRRDIKSTFETYYVGKTANTYDNKCVMITEIQAYFDALAEDGILEKGASSAEIDIEATKKYIVENGGSWVDMEEQEIREYNTGDKVFLLAKVRFIDAVEDVIIVIEM